MTAGTVRISMAPIEAVQLAEILGEFADLVGGQRDLSDPAVARLTPSAYPDDADAADEFAAATRDELLDRRSADTATVRAALEPLRSEFADLTEQQAFAEHDLAIEASDVDAWLRTLTAVRLVVATRLGIVDDEHHDPEDRRFHVYDWLGYRLDLLIEAADESLD